MCVGSQRIEHYGALWTNFENVDVLANVDGVSSVSQETNYVS